MEVNSPPSPRCQVHPEALATHWVDDAPACDTCAREAAAESDARGAAAIGIVGVGYLATLALSYRFFHARPFLGGLAAVVAIAIGRALQGLFRPKTVTTR